MQIRQQMDLDQNHEAHHPIKPTKSLLPQKRSNRTFGTNLTNQHRRFSNQQTATNKAQHAKLNVNDGFSFVKKPLIVKTKESKPAASAPSVESPPASPQSVASPESNMKTAERTEMEMDLVDCGELEAWDLADIDNDLCVTDYVADIISALRSDEEEARGIIANEMDFMNVFQHDINARMRSVLVDWLIEVHRKFKLLPATYFLGINLLDRFLSKRQMHRKQLQLCGCTCLWISSKYHEIYAPEMDDFVYISDNAFDAEDLMRMEVDILKTLGFTLTVPTALNYAQRFSTISSHYLKNKREIKIISDLIMYCVEQCVLSYNVCRKLPSMIGAACFLYACLSTKVFSIDTFKKDAIDEAIGYKFDILAPVMCDIDDLVRNAKKSKHRAVYRKYCNTKYSNIGKLNFDKLNTKFLSNDENDEQ